MALTIAFNAVNVNSMQSNAGIFTGENAQTGWFSPTKENNAIFGPGQLNAYFGNFNLVSDNDLVDQPNTDPDFNPTAQGQAL